MDSQPEISKSNVLFVMQVSIGGHNAAPLTVTNTANSISLAKEFVMKHQLPNEQITALSTQIDNIRNQLLSNKNTNCTQNINKCEESKQIESTTYQELTSADSIHSTDNNALNCSNPNKTQSQTELENIRNELSQFYQQQSNDRKMSLRKPSKIDIKIHDKKTRKVINKKPRKTRRSHRSDLVRTHTTHNSRKNKTKHTNNTNMNSKTHIKSRPCSTPTRRKDWWNKLHSDANTLQNKMMKRQKVAKALQRRQEIEGCTFKPKISAPARTLKRDGSKIWKRIVDPMGHNKYSRLKQLRHRKKIQDKKKYKKQCTFTPYVTDKSHKIMKEKKLNFITEITPIYMKKENNKNNANICTNTNMNS
eukprot:243972_1